MAEIDDELVARAIRWCAEAGRQAGAGEVRAALGALSWDQLLAARALLADPPPLRPLGPAALADIARGASPDVAAEREREGRYRREERDVAAPASAPTAPVRASRKRAAARHQPVIRRARDRVTDAPATERTLPLLDELHRPEGRAELEALVRRVGPVTPRLVEALAAGWRHPDGRPADEEALRDLLSHHGLDRALARREPEALLHALRAAHGVRRRAAAALGIPPASLDELLARAGATPQAEAIREQRRAQLRRRATLSERAHLVLEAREELEDLELLAEMERDLTGRLPDHLRALAAAPGALLGNLSRSLSLQRPETETLLRRLGVSLPPPQAASPVSPSPPADRPVRRTGAPPRGAPRKAAGAPARASGGPPRPRSGGASGAKHREGRGRPPSGPRRPRPL
ncbi:MAG: Fis family transcriptional regulator [Deltaproteobacteria bacterium]|nr:Fis family transcriptional regulator [Deltaproteobacteria bacterium]